MGGFPGPRRVEERLKRARQEWLLISDRIAHGQAEGRRLGMPASVAANSAAKGGGKQRERRGATAGEVRYAIKIFSWSNKAARARDSERARAREGGGAERER